jgi:hypothetical protein
MERCEEDVIIACGLYLLSEEEKREMKRGPYQKFPFGGRGAGYDSMFDFKNYVTKIML